MQRRTLYIIIVVAFIIVFGLLLLGYLSLNSNNISGSGESTNSPLGSFFSLFRGKNTVGPEATTTSPSVTIETDNGESAVIPRLRQVSNTPTAGAAFIVRNVATTTLVKGVLKPVTIPTTYIRYVERATGHIFETKPEILSSAKISNTTLPKIYEASFVKGGNSVLYRYLDSDENTIETFYASLVLPTPPKASSTATSTGKQATSTPVIATSSPLYELVGSLLPENIRGLVVSPGKDRIFYLQDTPGSTGSVGWSALPDNTSKRQVFSNPLREWLINWPGPNTIFLTTKPSGGVAGYLFSLNVGSGAVSRIFGNVAGLTVLPAPDGSSILYSSNNGSTFNLNVYTPANGLSSGISINTLPEKCVWSQKNTAIVYCAVPLSVPTGSYPDLWYQGAVSFTDSIWKINVRTGEHTLVAQPLELGQINVDAIDLTLDLNENYLMFINKKDLTLWNLLINPPKPPAPVTVTSTATSTATTTATTSVKIQTTTTTTRSTILR